MSSFRYIRTEPQKKSHQNIISNRKYSVLSLIPKVLYNQFSSFFDIYLLLIAVSQAIPLLKVSPLLSNLGPLMLVIFINLYKETTDDYKRYTKDQIINNSEFTALEKKNGEYKQVTIKSKDIKVGHVLLLSKNERIPADCVLITGLEKDSQIFVRTDQLDGETDWKLKLPTLVGDNLKGLFIKKETEGEKFTTESTAEAVYEKSNSLSLNAEILKKLEIKAEPPHKDIYSFIGSSIFEGEEHPISYENTLWQNTVLASSTVLALVVYTGSETRSSLNTAKARSKFGLIERDINKYTVTLFAMSLVVSIVCALFNQFKFDKRLIVMVVRYMVIFSGIIPISLKVTLDFARIMFYTRKVEESIEGCIVRSTNIPEELGRISYVLTDKTGTLTKNEMKMRKVHIGTICYSTEANREIKKLVTQTKKEKREKKYFSKKKDVVNKMKEMVKALSICHNVTPIFENDKVVYQASSPDEVAIVEWCENVGFKLMKRSQTEIEIEIDTIKDNNTLINNTLSNNITNNNIKDNNLLLKVKILDVFPFTSETKRMGIIVETDGEIIFYMKGADMIMKKIVKYSDWLEEEIDSMAREGLRTLVVGYKKLSQEEYDKFKSDYKTANLSSERKKLTLEVQERLETDLNTLGLTGVEDKLQENVMLTLEHLNNAGIKTWMLTGDKIETAISIAHSTRLFQNGIKKILKATDRKEALNEIQDMERNHYDYAVINGNTLAVYIDNFPIEMTKQLAKMEAVVACRCTPTQKSDITKLIKKVSGKRVLGIGDGGNDVSMITSADLGIGIVGKEGNQASLAADYSILRFCDISELILWHGRNAYTNSSRVIHYIIHRGALFSIVQGIICALFSFRPISLLQGFLAIGFVCVFTVCPMFCLVNYEKIEKKIVFKFPELYKELLDKKELSMKAFFSWFAISFYQASTIMVLTCLFFKKEMLSLISIIYSCMLINEYLIVFTQVGFYDKEVVLAMLMSFVLYVLCFVLRIGGLRIPPNFLEFIGKILVIGSASTVIILIEFLYTKYFDPETHNSLSFNKNFFICLY